MGRLGLPVGGDVSWRHSFCTQKLTQNLGSYRLKTNLKSRDVPVHLLIFSIKCFTKFLNQNSCRREQLVCRLEDTTTHSDKQQWERWRCSPWTHTCCVETNTHTHTHTHRHTHTHTHKHKHKHTNTHTEYQYQYLCRRNVRYFYRRNVPSPNRLKISKLCHRKVRYFLSPKSRVAESSNHRIVQSVRFSSPCYRG